VSPDHLLGEGAMVGCHHWPAPGDAAAPPGPEERVVVDDIDPAIGSLIGAGPLNPSVRCSTRR